MTRPQKQGLDYFPFPCDFFQHQEVIALTGEFGIKGQCVYIHLLTAIYRNGYFVKWDETLKDAMLFWLPGISRTLLDDVVDRLVGRLRIFDNSLFRSAGILTSWEIQEQFRRCTIRRVNRPARLAYQIDPPQPDYPTQESRSTEVSVDINPRSATVNVDINPIKKSKVNKKPPDGGKKADTDIENLSSRIDSFVAKLKSETIRIEAIAMTNRIPVEDTMQWIDTFRNYCIGEDTSHADYRDFHQHFARWLPYKLRDLRQQQNPQTPHNNGSDNRRRPADVQPGRPEEFNVTF